MIKFNAQACQDVFVNKILNKDNGFFVDIGAGTGGLRGHPVGFYSNTYFFESRGWSGIAIDVDEYYINSVKNFRKSKCICSDLLIDNINDILNDNNCPKEIDYLSLDVDDAQYKVFKDFNFEKYKFKILTLEHNIFRSFGADKEVKQKLENEHSFYKEKLKAYGYKPLWSNVCLTQDPFEDWYVNEEIFNKFEYLKADMIDCGKSYSI